MAPRIKRGEPVEKAVRRIVRAQLRDAIDAAAENGGTQEERVHEVRTRLKRSRAALALLRPQPGKRSKHDVRRLREAGRELARARDLAVQAKTLRDLAAHLGPGARPKLRARLAATADRVGRELAEIDVERTLRRSARLLRRLRRELDAAPLEHGRHVVLEGVTASYRKGQRALQTLRARPNPERFHNLRKRVKALSYQLQMVRAARGGPVAALARRLPVVDELAEILGQIHDLDGLRATVEEHPRWLGKETAAAVVRVDGRRARLESKAFALADELFSENRPSPRTHHRTP